jgi:DNA polymerase III delta prime subunit
VVSDGEEPDYLEEVDDIMENATPTGSQSGPKTLIRRSAASQNSKELAKLLNAVVISGPNGCGKTAAVYAVAKELNYQVFEINSSSRRSGKDILEKVGDMTRNHLVHHAKEEVTVDEDEQRAAASLQADLQSGRQGTMNSFFKTTAPKSKLSTQKKSKPTDNKPMNDGTLLKKATQQKHQKQSLILFEEVDVLFEEDKQFWATTLSLIVQSKRPIIMTCNDENLVVNQALPLHAILRFSPPPLDIAVDYMLLVAAHEGHILKRPAVSALYQAQKYDLRASMTELEFWCQIGVGDRRGGFDWHFNRWPRGVDQDEDGNTIRVISQDTYRTGMGWLGRDSLCSSTGKWHNNVEDEVLREAWVGCGIDAGDWYETLGLSKWAVDNKIRALDPQERLQALEAYDDFTEAMSASDLIAAGSFGYGNSTLLDTTMPAISDKVREDTTLGYSFLQADMLERHHTLARDLSISVRTLSRADTDARSVALSSGSSQKSILPPLSEKQFIRYTTSSRTRPPQGITRHDFGVALDPIAVPQGNQEVGKYLDHPSVIDRTTSIIAEDVAPYVRSIVAYDNKLAKERARLSNLLSEGGRTKRMRTTRSAFSALEGGQRGRVRRERWFGDEVNSVAVEKTAGRGWDNAREAVVEERRLVAIKALQEKQELREREEDAKGKVEAEARTGDVGEQGVDDDEDVEMEHT